MSDMIKIELDIKLLTIFDK